MSYLKDIEQYLYKKSRITNIIKYFTYKNNILIKCKNSHFMRYKEIIFYKPWDYS